MLTPPTSPPTGNFFLAVCNRGDYKRKRAEDSYDSLTNLFNDVLEEKIAEIDQKTLNGHFSKLNPKHTLKITKFLFDNPKVVSHIGIGSAQKLSIKPWGEAKHTFAEFPIILMKIIGGDETNISLFQDELSLKINMLFKKTVFKTSALDALPELNQEHSQLLGRTITIPDPANPGFLLAHKFKRVDEEMADFCREKAMTKLFKKSGRFLSTLPEPLGNYTLKKIDDTIAARLPNDIDIENPTVYIQRVRPSYYKYLHEIVDDKEWEEARKKFLIDSALQIRSGQMPPFADLYHNQYTNRRYQPLINLIPTYKNGAGRVKKPFHSVKFPNAGAGGIRDAGDGDLIADLIENPIKETSDLFSFKENKMPYMLMNAYTKLTFVDTIMQVYRLKKLGKLDWEDENIIAKTAKDLKDGQKWILQSFLDCDPNQADEFIEALPIDWEKQAKQMIFWLQTDSKGYIGYLETAVLPRGLYENEMKVEIKLDQAENYTSLSGFRIDDKRDAGCYNGPLGWLAHEKSWYFIAAIAFGNFIQKFAIYHDKDNEV